MSAVDRGSPRQRGSRPLQLKQPSGGASRMARRYAIGNTTRHRLGAEFVERFRCLQTSSRQHGSSRAFLLRGVWLRFMPRPAGFGARDSRTTQAMATSSSNAGR